MRIPGVIVSLFVMGSGRRLGARLAAYGPRGDRADLLIGHD